LQACLSIIIATLMTVGDVSAGHSIAHGSFVVSQKLGFSTAFLGVTNIAIAFSSHSCFFSVISEFKKPEDFPKAMALLQIVDTGLYLIAALVIYLYVGSEVPSPALSAAATKVMRKAIWGVAIPTIVIAGVIYGHVAAKYIFLRIFRNTKHLERRTKLSTISWFALTFAIWALSMIVADAFVSWFSYGLPGLFWLWMHKGNWFSSKAQTVRFVANAGLLLCGFLICVLGMWASIEAIANEEITKPWSCKSNAAK
jgi:hypothetical protein